VVIGVIISAVLLLTTALVWHSQFKDIRLIYPAMRHLGQQISQAQALNDEAFDDIVIYGDANVNRQMTKIHSNRALRNFLFKEFNIYARSCKPDFCRKISIVLAQANFTAPLLIIDGKLVVILSPQTSKVLDF
jgi:hypothetical protein